MSIINVCLMGIGVVFAGLICIIALCYIMSFFCRKTIKETPQNTAPAAPSVTEAPIQNKQEMIAAIAAAVAEDLGTDVSALRILSVKKI